MTRVRAGRAIGWPAGALLPLALLVGACSVDADSASTTTAALPDLVLPPAVEPAAGSTVVVEGTACRVAVRGSGFVIEPGLVVTAAHVVAGVDRPSVRSGDGTAVPAVPVAFDPGRDVAVLAVESPTGFGPPPPRRDPVPMEDAVVLARDEDAALDPVAVRVVEVIVAQGPDIHGDGSFTREVAVLEGAVSSGDSGAPVVGADGSLFGMVVAVSTERPGTAYAVRPAELDAVSAAHRGVTVPTGPCP